MSRTKYSIGHSTANLLRRYGVDQRQDGWRARLEAGVGDESDVSAAAVALAAIGEHGLADHLRAMLPSPPAGRPGSAHPAPCPGEGEHPSDLTITCEHRAALRDVARGERPVEYETLAVLLRYRLIHLEGGRRWALTPAGHAYLAAHDQAVTRRLPRPAPPAVPHGWRQDRDDRSRWFYDGKLTDVVEYGEYDLDARLEAAEARLALLNYLRARRAHESRSGDTTEQEPAEVTLAGDPAPSGHDGCPGESSHSEVAP